MGLMALSGECRAGQPWNPNGFTLLVLRMEVTYMHYLHEQPSRLVDVAIIEKNLQLDMAFPKGTRVQ
jgi:hypothetical protein